MAFSLPSVTPGGPSPAGESFMVSSNTPMTDRFPVSCKEESSLLPPSVVRHRQGAGVERRQLNGLCLIGDKQPSRGHVVLAWLVLG